MSICEGAKLGTYVEIVGDCTLEHFNLEIKCNCEGKTSSCQSNDNDVSYVCKAEDRKRTSRKLRRKVHH